MATINRRSFLMGSAAAGAGLLAGSAPARAKVRWAPDKVRVGMIGTAAQAGWNMGQLESNASVTIAALCDVDDNLLAAAASKHPDAKTYNDFRKLIEQNGLDAVLVATPDHIHAPATLMALSAGLHVYCEKPLTHTVWEARAVAKAAAKNKRVTQMGTQIHAGGNYRRVVELVQGGAIGTVKEVHVWVGRENTAKVPPRTPPVPTNLHWDLWLGPAQERPYSPDIVPFNWRWWWAFGGGTLGDMGCHHIDLPKWALKLGNPLSVEAIGDTQPDAEVTPLNLTVKYRFPHREGLPAVDLTWYHGDKRPQVDTLGQMDKFGAGTLFVGEKGMLLADYDRRMLLPEKDFAGFEAPKPSIPDSIGHHNEWIEAIKNGTPTTCSFEYSGALTEAVLLGNVSYRAGKRLEWDAKALKAKNCPESDRFIRPVYREPYDKILK